MLRCVLVAGGMVFASLAFSQDSNLAMAPFEGRQFTADKAQAAEAAIAADPEDVVDRVRLLGYDWTLAQQGLISDTNKAARLDLLLWLITHHPELNVFTLPESSPPTESARDQMAQAWGQALTAHSSDEHVLVNAAWFYRLSDKQQSIDILRRALTENPSVRDLSERLGNEYALLLLGVKALDTSGKPAQFDSAEANSALARTARLDLEGSTQPGVLYAAGNALNLYRSEAEKSGIAANDIQKLAANLLDRAKALDPTGSQNAPQRIRVGGNVQAANLVKKVTPLYPAEAKQAGIQGIVRFSVLIGRDGTIQTITLISGHPLLVPAAQEAVKQWVYKPTLLNGLPVEVATQIDVNFTLSPAPDNRI